LYTNPEDGFECVIDKKYYNNKRLNNQAVEMDACGTSEDYEKLSFIDEMRYAHSRVDWKPMYCTETGEIYSTPFDE
jgi:hypothetical protein